MNQTEQKIKNKEFEKLLKQVKLFVQTIRKNKLGIVVVDIQKWLTNDTHFSLQPRSKWLTFKNNRVETKST